MSCSSALYPILQSPDNEAFPSVIVVLTDCHAAGSTRTFHGGCSAEDPSGVRGNGPNNLLRAVYILGMTPTCPWRPLGACKDALNAFNRA